MAGFRGYMIEALNLRVHIHNSRFGSGWRLYLHLFVPRKIEGGHKPRLTHGIARHYHRPPKGSE